MRQPVSAFKIINKASTTCGKGKYSGWAFHVEPSGSFIGVTAPASRFIRCRQAQALYRKLPGTAALFWCLRFQP